MNSHKFLIHGCAAFALALSGIAAAAQEAPAAGAVDPAFQNMDQNHDGRLSRAEIPHDMVLLRTRFTTYDRNQDNQLDPQEFTAAQTAMKGNGNAMGSDSAPAPERHESHR